MANQDDEIRVLDAGQPKVVQVGFHVTVTMTQQQADAYAADFGVVHPTQEIKARLLQDVPPALRAIEWLGPYARVEMSRPLFEASSLCGSTSTSMTGGSATTGVALTTSSARCRPW